MRLGTPRTEIRSALRPVEMASKDFPGGFIEKPCRASGRISSVPDGTVRDVGFTPLGHGAKKKQVSPFVADAVEASQESDFQKALSRSSQDVRAVLLVDRPRCREAPAVDLGPKESRVSCYGRWADVGQDLCAETIVL